MRIRVLAVARARSLVAAFVVAAPLVLDATPAAAQNMGTYNANNTLGGFGLNRGRILLGDLRRPEEDREDGGVASASAFGMGQNGLGQNVLGQNGLGLGVASFTADELDGAASDGGSPIAFHSESTDGGVLNLWTAAAYSDFESQYGAIGSEGYMAQVQIGGDIEVSDNVLIGLMIHGDALEAETDNANPAASAINTDSRGFLAGGYAVLGLSHNIHAELLALAGISSNEYGWTVIAPTQAQYQSDRLVLMGGLVGDWREGAWGFRPEARLSYYAERREEYRDNFPGVGGPNVFPEDTTTLGQVRLGGEISYDLLLGDLFLRPYVGAEGVWAYHQDQLSMTIAPGPVTQTVTPDDLSGAFSLGFDAQLGGASLRAGGRYDGAGADDFDALTGELMLRVPLN